MIRVAFRIESPWKAVVSYGLINLSLSLQVFLSRRFQLRLRYFWYCWRMLSRPGWRVGAVAGTAVTLGSCIYRDMSE
jgi:hypothetical protein